jgi:hypothetical protein
VHMLAKPASVQSSAAVDVDAAGAPGTEGSDVVVIRSSMSRHACGQVDGGQTVDASKEDGRY